MRNLKCDVCGSSVPLASGYRIHNPPAMAGKFYCKPCLELAAQQAAAGTKIEVFTEADPTICGKCQTDFGSSELPRVGGLPVCPQCHDSLYNRPYPAWLRLGLVGTLLLLAFALVHDLPYFRIEKSLILGERLIDKHQYAAAVPELRRVVAVAPDCERCLLLLGKAEMLSGDFESAFKRLPAHNGGQYEKGELLDEVNAITRRIDGALDKYDKANKAYKDNKADEAVRLMRQSAKEYPEQPALADAADGLEIDIAFTHQEYDEFLRLAEQLRIRHPDSPSAVGQVASALACKYAVSGDAQFRARAEETLNAAGGLAASGTAEEKQAFAEYEERIRHRLDTRLIIDRDEYIRRFHPERAAKTE